MKGVKQLPSEEQPGNKDPSACREVLGPIRKLKKNPYTAGPCCAQYRKPLTARWLSVWQRRIEHLHNPKWHGEKR